MKRALLFLVGVVGVPQRLREVATAGEPCGPSEVGKCLAACDEKFPAEISGGECEENEVCCVTKKIKQQLGDMDAIELAQETWRIITPGAFGIDKAFNFITAKHGEKVSIESRKGMQASAFLDKRLFGPSGLGLSFTGIEGGLSHKKSTSKGWFQGKKKSPAVTVTCANCAEITLEAGLKALDIEHEPKAAELLMFNSLKEKLANAQIADESIDVDAVSNQQTAAFLVKIGNMFCATPGQPNGNTLTCE